MGGALMYKQCCRQGLKTHKNKDLSLENKDKD